MKGELALLMGTSLRLLNKATDTLRNLSPHFHPDESRQWSQVDLQALAVHFAYRYGKRKESLLSFLPEDFPPQMFKEIDEKEILMTSLLFRKG